LATEADQFDCEECPIADALDGLMPENASAWRIFHRLASRFLVDTHLTQAIFERLTAGWHEERVLDLAERLELIYSLLCPPPPHPTS
jgi:hypothetical protein